MSEIVRNSLIYRWGTRAAHTIHRWWESGLIARGIAAVRNNYQKSCTRRIWEGWGNSRNRIEDSTYARFMHAVRRLFERIGDCLAQSVFYRFLLAIKRGYLRLSSHSKILSFINRISLRQWVLVAFALYLPINYVLKNVVSISALSAGWEEAFIIFAALLIIWRRALRQTDALNRETALDAWLILFMAVGFLLMSIIDPYPAIAFEGYRAVVEYMVWFFLIIRLVENDQDMKVLYITVLLLTAFLAFHGIYQYVIGVEIPSSWVSQTEMGVRTRVFSLCGSPNILGSLMVMTAPLWAALIYFCRSTKAKLLALFMTVCCCLTLLFTFSRGAWIGIVVAVVIFALFVDKRLLALLGIAVAAILAFVPSITSRLPYLFTSDYTAASTTGGRAIRWALGQELLHENSPWLGFGLGRFGGAVAMNNQVLDTTEEFSYFYMDNYYLKTMVEMGYLGIIFYALLLIALIVLGIKAIQRSDVNFARLPGDPLQRAVGNYRVLTIAIFAGLCGVLAHCFFENIFEETYMEAYFWGLAGLMMYLGFFHKRRGNVQKDPPC